MNEFDLDMEGIEEDNLSDILNRKSGAKYEDDGGKYFERDLDDDNGSALSSLSIKKETVDFTEF